MDDIVSEWLSLIILIKGAVVVFGLVVHDEGVLHEVEAVRLGLVGSSHHLLDLTTIRANPLLSAGPARGSCRWTPMCSWCSGCRTGT